MVDLQKFFRSRIRWMMPKKIAVKLALILGLLVICVLTVLGVILTHVAGDFLKDSARGKHEDIAVRAAHEAALFLARPLELLDVVEAMIARTQRKAWDQETILVELSLRFSEFEEILSLDEKGEVIASSSPEKPKGDYAEDTAFREAIQGNKFTSEIWIGEDYLPRFTLAIPSYQMGNIRGVLRAQVNLRGIWDPVDSIRIGDSGRAFLISREGLIIAHPDKRLVLRNKNINTFLLIPKMNPLKGSQAFTGEDGKLYLASYAAVQGAPSLLVVIQMNMKEAYALLDRMKFLVWVWLLVSLAVSIGVSIFLSRRLVQPIKSLHLWSKKVTSGDLDYRAAPQSLDELGRLFIMFNRMRKRLKTAREREHLAALGETASMISHKLKNAIVSLKTFAQVFPSRKQEEQFLERFEKNFSSNVQYLEKMFHHLSQVSSSKAAQMDWLDIGRLFLELQSDYDETLEQSGVEWVLNVPEELPQVYGDPDQLKEVFDNLIQNSLQAMPRGGVLKLEGRYDSRNGVMTLAVSDTGIGISRENLERVFKPFFTTKNGGMGLGLAIAKRIVEEHSGSIAVQSTLKAGTTFTLKLPGRLENQISPNTAAVTETSVESPNFLGKL